MKEVQRVIDMISTNCLVQINICQKNSRQELENLVNRKTSLLSGLAEKLCACGSNITPGQINSLLFIIYSDHNIILGMDERKA